MLNWYFLVQRVKLRFLFIVFIALIIKCDGISTSEKENSCPFIETLSFGLDIDIKCNNTYLTFNEINNKELNWKFANQSSYCDQKGKQQGFVNQCSITRIDSKYLKVTLKSLEHNEYACIYCPINYKPIAPMISVNRSNDGQDTLYTFTLNATGLDHDESFEILWAKRSKEYVQNSFNYWIWERCIDFDIHILENTGHAIVFAVDDVPISRVEFIIRRCNGTCRSYDKCDEGEFSDPLSSHHFQIPDSIEKISCDYDCLNGIVTTTTMNTILKENLLLSPTQLSKKKQTIKFLIFFPILGFSIVLFIIILGCFIISRIKGLRTHNVYTKTSTINLDENKETIE